MAEVERPERNIPVAIMGTVGIGFVTSWFYSVGMVFSINGRSPPPLFSLEPFPSCKGDSDSGLQIDLDALFNTPTGVPLLALFNQALRSRDGALVLELLILSTGLGCQIASQT